MPSCIVKGCGHHTSMKSSNRLLTMHVFPREFSRIKLWLQQIRPVAGGDVDVLAARILEAAKSGKYRICSAHFPADCYSSVGCRLVLKHDAVPSLFPGVYPKPAPHCKPLPQHPAGRTHPRGAEGLPRKDAATQTVAEGDKTRPSSLNTSLMERCHRQEEIFDANGRLVGVFSPDTRQRDLRVRPGLWTYDWSTQTPKEPAKTRPPMENKEALSSLEKVLFSLLKHMADAPHSRPQKQRTSRLLNRTADIISILTGEEWTVVKKNAHISKFYQMIREVPIKCGDAAMFFTMEEWDYIEEHEERYKPVMLDNPKEAPPPVTPDCGTFRNKSAKRCAPPPQKRRSSPAEAGPAGGSSLSHTEPLREEEDASQTSDSPEDAHRTHHADEELIKGEESVESDTRESADTECPPPSEDATQTVHTARSHPVTLVPSGDTPPGPPCDPPPRKELLPAVGQHWERRNESHQSESSELWIAQDGTTSSLFIPQDDPRPPGWPHKTDPQRPGLLQCPVSSSDPESAVTPECGEWKGAGRGGEHFHNKHQLAAHQKVHRKRPRR